MASNRSKRGIKIEVVVPGRATRKFPSVAKAQAYADRVAPGENVIVRIIG